MKEPLHIICDAGSHCPTCRNLEGGRDWRIALAQVIEVPSVDFPCPRNLPWGQATPMPPTPPPLPEPLPRDQWPWYIRMIADQAWETDHGVGDTIHRELGETGERYKLAMQAAQIPCGCDDRQAWLNARFPYSR